MSKIAYLVDISQRNINWFLKKMLTKHPVVFSLSGGISPSTMKFWQEEGVKVFDLNDALNKNILNIVKSELDDLLLLATNSPPGKLEVLYKGDASTPYCGEIILWRPISNEESETNIRTALTVAFLQSFGFLVINENERELIPYSIAPHAIIEIVGKGDVEYGFISTSRRNDLYPHRQIPRSTTAQPSQNQLLLLSLAGTRFTMEKRTSAGSFPGASAKLTKRYRDSFY